MSSSVTPSDAREAREVLIQIAGRRTQPVPAELIVDHVLALPGAWDWPVRRAALEAVLRRFASVRAQELTVVDAPARGPWGRYRLARGEGDAALRYDVRLWSLSPLRGSCGCADFVRAELGLCKHLGAVLLHLARKPRVFGRLVATPGAGASLLVWDPAVAAASPLDRLASLQLVAPSNGARARRPTPRIAKLFRAGNDGVMRLRSTHADAPNARLHLVGELLAGTKREGARADPAARTILSEEHARLTRVARVTAAREAFATASRDSTRRKLYAYQKEGVRRFLAQGRLVLADDMGLGKTTQAVVAATALHGAGLVKRGLLVVPASLKPQWEREWQAISAVPVRVVEGSASERRAIYSSTRRGFLVANYEQVIKDVDAIAEWAPDLVILDEAQRLKNWATKTAQSVKRLSPPYRLVLTGTPLENRLEELASIVEWVDDTVLEPKWRLAPWYSAHGDGRREVVGARNLGELRAARARLVTPRARRGARPASGAPGHDDPSRADRSSEGGAR